MRLHGRKDMPMENERAVRCSGLLAALGGLVVPALAAWGTNNVLEVDGRQRFSVPLVARVTNLSDSACRDTLSAQIVSALVKDGVTMDTAKTMSADTLAALSYSRESRPFYAFSPSDVRYGFFVQKTKSGCVLRLYQRESQMGAGRGAYTNTWNYIATRSIAECSCPKNTSWPDEDLESLVAH